MINAKNPSEQWNAPLGHLHAVKHRPIPIRTLVGLVGKRLHMVQENAAARRLQTHYHKTDADLQHAGQHTAKVDGDDGQAVVHTE